MDDLLRTAIRVSQGLNKDAPKRFVPPSTGAVPKSQMVLPHSLVTGTRVYLENLTREVNGCYENGWFDGCLVLMRRLFETLIIECYESASRISDIQDNQGNIISLDGLVGKITKDTTFIISRNARKSLLDVKKYGDLSAHNRTFIAHRQDVDNIQIHFRSTVQELLSIANVDKVSGREL